MPSKTQFRICKIKINNLLKQTNSKVLKLISLTKKKMLSKRSLKFNKIYKNS